jgi:predicted small integral membrane protein
MKNSNIDFNLKTAYSFIIKNWYGIIIGYVIVLFFLWFGIWSIIEPLDINPESKIINFDSIFPNRRGNHILICLLVAPYITLAFLIINNFKSNNTIKPNSQKQIFDGKIINKLDFIFDRKKRWDGLKRINYGIEGTGSFDIQNNIISLERNNDDGVCYIDLVSYNINGSKSKFIPRDISRGGARSFQITFQIKLSGKGQQSIYYVLKDYNSTEWQTSKKIIIENKDWLFYNFILKTRFDKDLNLRIESKDVSIPTSSVQIKDLSIYET